MAKLGVSLLITSFIFWIIYPISAIFTDTVPNVGFIKSLIALGVVGVILILISVVKDRYQEYKEDQKNDDYRQY